MPAPAWRSLESTQGHATPGSWLSLQVLGKGAELLGPAALGGVEPRAKIRHRRRPQRVNAYARIVGRAGLGDQTAIAQDAQVLAHRRGGDPDGAGELAGAAGVAREQPDCPTSSGICERGERVVDPFC